MPVMTRVTLVLFLTLSLVCAAADIRLGIIGTDTSHCAAFIKILNDASAPNHVPGARIVAAYKGGSPDLKSSASRVEQYATELSTKWGVEIVPDIASLCSKVDGILLESVDGRKHLEQVRQAVACGKPMFIDKPLASTLEDAREIARITKQAGVPWFSSSSLRWSPLVTSVKFADNIGVTTWGPGPMEPSHYLDLSWYGIHPVEMLYTLMGTGCEEVTRVSVPNDPGSDVVVGRWKDGRLGTVRVLRPYGPYGAIVFRPKLAEQSTEKAGVPYDHMLGQIVQFFRDGKPPVSNEETLELFAFMDAAQRSKEAGGKPVRLR